MKTNKKLDVQLIYDALPILATYEGLLTTVGEKIANRQISQHQFYRLPRNLAELSGVVQLPVETLNTMIAIGLIPTRRVVDKNGRRCGPTWVRLSDVTHIDPIDRIRRVITEVLEVWQHDSRTAKTSRKNTGWIQG